MRFLKKIIKLFLASRGYLLFRKYYYDFNGDTTILKVFNELGIDFKILNIFDVGANVGQSVTRFRRILPDAMIYSFEPNPDVFLELQKEHKDDSAVEFHNVGVGDESGNKTFYIQPDSGASSFLELNTDNEIYRLSNTKLAIKNHNKTTLKQSVDHNTPINVPVITLQEFMNNNDIGLVHLLKIDTQGFEPQVLKGCGSRLKDILMIECEIMFSDTYDRASSFRDIENVLADFGFMLWDIPYIGKFATDKCNRINFVDALYVNKALCDKFMTMRSSPA